jgi:hypothetical protein
MIGSLLSALSGLVNGCLMVHAHVLARARRPVLAATLAAMPAAKLAPELAPARHPALFVACTWLVPGLGHWLQGRKLRAAIVFVLLVGLFALGTLLSEGSNLSRERHFYFWSGQFLLGLPAIAVELLSGRPPVTHDIEWADAGLTFACIAGLLNVLAMLDVYAWAEELWFGRDPLASSEVRADAARPAPGAAAK